MMCGEDMDHSGEVCADNIGALLIHRDGKQVKKSLSSLFA